MREFTKRAGLILLLVVLFAFPADAATDNGNGTCVQEDGQVGVWNGTSPDDAGCTTTAEYAVMFSPDGLLESGVIVGYVVDGDEAVLDFGDGTSARVKGKALDRVVAANEGEPGPTVREWFDSRLPGPR